MLDVRPKEAATVSPRVQEDVIASYLRLTRGNGPLIRSKPDQHRSIPILFPDELPDVVFATGAHACCFGISEMGVVCPDDQFWG